MKKSREDILQILEATHISLMYASLLFIFIGLFLFGIILWGASFIICGIKTFLGKDETERPYGVMMAVSSLLYTVGTVLPAFMKTEGYQQYISFVMTFSAILLVLTMFHKQVENVSKKVSVFLKDLF